MSKRRPGTELNHDNWDQAEESEEPGLFQPASTDKLSQRKIKVAKRRIGGDGEESQSRGLFSGFSGFGAPPAAPKAVLPAKPVSPTKPVSPAKPVSSANSLYTAISSTSQSRAAMFGSKTMDTKPLTRAGLKDKSPTQYSAKRGKIESEDSAEDDDQALLAAASASGESTASLAKLRSLNDGIMKCVQDHLSQNPFIDLRRTFDSYATHYTAIFGKNGDQKNGSVQVDEVSEGTTGSCNSAAVKDSSISEKGGNTGSSNSNNKSGLFSFGLTTSQPSSSGGETAAPSASFSLLPQTNSTTAKPSGLFGLPINSNASGDSANKNGFGSTLFPGSGSSFSFGFTKPATDTCAETVSQDTGESVADEDKPPVVELVDVPEEDSLYSIRCKLFFMKDGNFVEKGLGSMHLKEIADEGDGGSSKKQLLIRAGTRLGNVLLNICLTEETPLERVGKNNVRIVCVANPPVNPKASPEELAKPTTMLIRVKTDADADAVLQKMKQFVAGEKL